MLRLIDPADRSLLDVLVAGFLSEAPAMRATLRRAVDNGDRWGLQAGGRRLKGAAMTMGLPAVAAVSGEIETLGAAGRVGGARVLLSRLDDELERATTGLSAATAALLLAHPPAAGPP